MSNEPQSVDLVHVRDVIQHMTLQQGVAYFCNVFQSGARVLIATTFPAQTSNPDVPEGSYYKNNLFLEPFSFPRGKCVPTHPTVEDDDTCVFDLKEGNWTEEYIRTKC